MFGDQFYPTNAEFLLDVAAEVRDQVWRMASHASLGVWCGNNEMAGG
jgi:beta-mannosidase